MRRITLALFICTPTGLARICKFCTNLPAKTLCSFCKVLLRIGEILRCRGRRAARCHRLVHFHSVERARIASPENSVFQEREQAPWNQWAGKQDYHRGEPKENQAWQHDCFLVVYSMERVQGSTFAALCHVPRKLSQSPIPHHNHDPPFDVRKKV